MHFCLTGQYTPRALNAILEKPTVSREEAARKLIEAAGGKLISMYSVAADGPGVLVIFDVPDRIRPQPSPPDRHDGRASEREIDAALHAGRDQARAAERGQAAHVLSPPGS